MNTNAKISSSQIIALMLVSRLLSTITFMPVLNTDVKNTDYIISMLIGGLLTLLFLIPTIIFTKKQKSVVGIAKEISNSLSKIISILYALLFLAYAFSTLVRMNLFVSAVVFPNTNTTLFLVLSIIATCYAASLGIEAIGRASSISLFIFLASFVVILLALVNRVDINNLSPMFYDGVRPVFKISWSVIIRSLEPSILLVIIDKSSEKITKKLIGWVIAFSLIMTVIFFFLMSSLGESALLQMFPIHSMAVLAEFGVFERMDSLLMGMWILSAFIKVGFLIFLVADLISTSFSKLKSEKCIVTVGILLSLAILLESSSITLFRITTSMIIRSIVFLLFVVIIPLLIITIDKLKMGERQ